MRKKSVWLLLAASVVLRLLAAQIDAAYQNDVLTFQVWAADLYAFGFSKFYGNGFTDYPPGYMYVLYGIGAIRAWLDLAFLSPAYNLLIRLPAILCDAATGYFIYWLAARKINLSSAGILAALYLFNPAVILDSAVWGQVDAVYTLLLCVSLYFVQQKRLLPAYGLYGVAILTKPQSLILAPIYIYSAYMYLREHRYTARSVGRLAACMFIAAVAMLLLALPFTHQWSYMPILAQYYATLDSYAYGSVNAYNFFALIGGNWAPLSTTFLGVSYTVWGFIFIVLITLGAFFALAHKHTGDQLFLIAAALNALTFMFSVKMHERYLFPSLAFLLIAFIDKRNRRILWLYAGFSIAFLLNCADVLRMLKNGNALEVIAYTQPIISMLYMGLTAFLLYTFFSFMRTRSPTEQEWVVSASLSGGSLRMKIEGLSHTPFPLRIPRIEEPVYIPPPRLTKVDFIMLGLLISVYTALAFINLGDTRIPQTTWSPKAGELAIIDLGDVREISRIQFMMGAKHDASFMIYASQDGQDWFYDEAVMEANVFAWTDVWVNDRIRYLEVIPFSGDLMLQEIAMRDTNGLLIPITDISPDALALVDEQHLVPDSATYMNGTYFDEIYHARTAYEYIYGILAYENTHPPLGKDIIALGIWLFGMTPFGWRAPGVLVGILMIPLLYQFARYVLRSNHWAFFAAFIFTFDFMHFTQTRIATIDTYVVYFVMGMYYYMYRYRYQRQRKHFLFFSGLFMGMAIAAKWQGVYAAIGLPLLFFPAWYPTYKADKRSALYTLAACVVFFVIIPVIVYTLAYLPFMRGAGGGLATMIDNQRHMLWYHSSLVSEHAFSSRWWEWPLITRPVYYYANTVSDTLKQGISAFGNPAVWWFGMAATVYAFYSLYKRYKYDLVFLLVAYGAQYLPWVLVSRTTYLYHYFPSVPFVVLLIAYFFKERSETTPMTGAKKYKYVILYAGVVLGLFVLFYPVLSGLPFPVAFVHRYLRWLPGWVLM